MTESFQRIFNVEIRAPKAGGSARSVRVVASSAAIDSYDEIIEQDWDLSRYEKNPVVLWNHNRTYGDDPKAKLPIGFATDVAVEDGKLVATLNFVDEKANPLAELVFQGFQQGSLRAVSVGFLPKDYRLEKRDGRDVYVLAGNELHEISAVPVPANPEAVLRSAHLEELRALGASREPEKEENMKIEEELAATKTSLAGAEKGLAEARLEVKTLQMQNAKLVEERDAALAREKAATEVALDAEVSKLVGVKISPAEKDDFVELARSNRPLFERMVKQRSDLKLLGASTLGSEGLVERKVHSAGDDDLSGDLNAIEKEARN